MRAVDALRVAMRRDKTLNLLEGCAPATAELSRWVHEICAKPAQRLFVAGDGGTGQTPTLSHPGSHLGGTHRRKRKGGDGAVGTGASTRHRNRVWPKRRVAADGAADVRHGQSTVQGVLGFLRDAVDRRGGTLLQVRGRDAGARECPVKVRGAARRRNLLSSTRRGALRASDGAAWNAASCAATGRTWRRWWSKSTRTSCSSTLTARCAPPRAVPARFRDRTGWTPSCGTW